MALKPLPKLIIIAAVVGGAGYAGLKFLPDAKKEAAPVAEAPAATPAPAPAATPVVNPPQAVAEQAAAPTPAPAQEAPKQLNTSNGDAGLAAVLGAGKK